MFGLQSGLPVQGAKWDELREKDFEGRLDAINDETFCKALVSEARVIQNLVPFLSKRYFYGLR